ncbi:MAG: ATP-binding protein [Gammaproteobacteria bacterium]|nr:ATP-binding protein [Gammaproteobacteria bacterium]
MAPGKIKRLNLGIMPMLLLFALLLVSLWLISDATHNSERFGEHYSWLLVLNAVILVMLGAMVVANIIWLVRQQRKQAVGAKLTTRLVIMFAVLSIVPVSLVYYFSLQFLQRGIDSWFDVQIEQALEDALDLSRTALDVRLRDVLRLSQDMADEIAESPAATIALNLYDIRVRSGAAELTLLGSDGRIIASSSADPTDIVPYQPSSDMLQVLHDGRHYIGLVPVGESGLHAIALVPVASSREDGEVYAFVTLFSVSERLSELAGNVQSAFSHYKELSYLRKPLKFSYTVTLSIVLVLSMLAAIWAAFQSARRTVAPVREMARATRAVAEGDYSKRLAVASDDELGFLVRSFNDMTRRLAKARDQARKSQYQVEGQRAYLEAVLANLSSGVISLDAGTVIRAVNSVARQNLGMDIKSYLGKPISTVAEDHASLKPFIDVVERYRRQRKPVWQEEVSLFGARGRQVLMCRGTQLKGIGSRRGGHVIVFDDVTELIQAQRNAAWGEVARRLAHEIKNPLTPIQLSAERLRRRFIDRMGQDDVEVLDRATRTIINQVEAMKKMVNAFSEYARVPRISMEAVDLHQLIQEVLDLYRDNGVKIRIATRLDATNSCIEGDTGRLRQLLHNLIKNAQEAFAEGGEACITVSTQSVGDAERPTIDLFIDDNGPGFKQGMLDNIFEPYVSSKRKGSGLGLAIVKKIVEEHGGVISAGTGPDGGARIHIRLQALGQEACASAEPGVGNEGKSSTGGAI